MPAIIDLRSDTVTKPTAGMREAMARADVGDDVYGEDPTVRRLEEEVAGILGKEAALFTPTGTMANQLALLSQTERGDEVLADQGSHVLHFESGAAAALAGVQIMPVSHGDGTFTVDAVRKHLRPVGTMIPRAGLVWVENTHNKGGGTVWPLAQLRAVAAESWAAGLSVHLDGARLWNAAVASGNTMRDFAACADTASVCLSKGLGAPAGSLFAGSRQLVDDARRLRHRLGGGMRQVGVLAAAGLYALAHHRQRLAEDHVNARRLAEALVPARGLEVSPERVQTNMVYARVRRGEASSVMSQLRDEGVLVNALSSDTLRLVTHLDVSAEAVEEAARRIVRVVQ